MTRFLRFTRRRQPAVPRADLRRLSGLRFDPVIMSGPVNPADDPCGAGPMAEPARRRAIATLIAAASRYLR